MYKMLNREKSTIAICWTECLMDGEKELPSKVISVDEAKVGVISTSSGDVGVYLDKSSTREHFSSLLWNVLRSIKDKILNSEKARLVLQTNEFEELDVLIPGKMINSGNFHSSYYLKDNKITKATVFVGEKEIGWVQCSECYFSDNTGIG